MSKVNASQSSTNNQKLKRASLQKQTSDQQTKGADFKDQLKKMLKPNGKNLVREKDVFAALVNKQIGDLKGDQAHSSFMKNFQEFKASKKGQSERGLIYATNRALKRVRVEGHLTRDEAHMIRRQALGAAQTDGSVCRLDRGNAAAGVDLESALENAFSKMSAYQTGEEVALSRAQRKQAYREYLLANGKEVAGEGNKGKSNRSEKYGKAKVPSDGFEGFLFKPASDHGGKLVVLMPSNYGNGVQGVTLKDAKGKVIEKGNSSGFANGNREHFRFSQAGASYPKNIYLEISFKGGKELVYKIPDPSQRYD